MRILAIRGQNLASLADWFEIDFEAEPIRTAGIFAISGPTGAGKSTLLDAMCLALFDQLPRFDHADRGRIGQDDGSQQTYDDVRNVLRHGAVEAFAEVDFTGQDGRSYRARWQVRRARGRADGKIQDQVLTLNDLSTGERIGDKKKEALAEIARRVGLSFQQFRRAVLLAQGDFDTFIKADARSRAELLERITGTGIYAQLSKAAFDRRRSLEQALKALEDQLAGHRPLDPEARSTAVAAEREARLALDEIVQERERLARAAAWHQTCQRLVERLAEAEQAVAAAEAADQAEEAVRVDLALCERGLAVRAELDDLRRTEHEIQNKGQLLADAQAAAAAASARAEEAALAQAAAAARCVDLRREVEEAEPELRHARDLDTLLSQLGRELATRQAELQRREVEQAEAEAAHARATQAHRSAMAERDALLRWMDGHRNVEALVPQVDRIAADLEALAVADARLKEQEARAQELAEQQQDMRTERAVQAERVAALKAELAALEQRIDLLQAEIEGLNQARKQQRLDDARTLVAALDDLIQAARELGRARAADAAAEQEEERSAATLTAAAQELSLASQERPVAAARHEEARRGLELSAAAASEQAQHLRLLLVPGVPCPVCGATEHADTAVDFVLANRAEADRRRVAELERTLQQVDARVAGARARIETVEQAKPELVSRRKLAKDELDRASSVATLAAERARDLGHAFDPDFPELPDDPAACDRDGLAQHLGRATAAQAQAAADLTHAASLQADLLVERERRETLRQGKTTAEQAERKLIDREQELELERRGLGMRRDLDRQEVMRIRAQLEDRLEPVFDDWLDRTRRDPRRLAEECRRVAAEWTGQVMQLHQVEERLAACLVEMKEREASLSLRTAGLEEAKAVQEGKAQECAEIRAERAELLGGRAVAEVEADLRRRLKEAEDAQETAALAMGTAADQQLVAQETSSAATRAFAAAEAEQVESVRKLVTALESRQISREHAEQALARGEAWLVAERERLAALRRMLDDSRAMATERRKALAEHEQSGRPAETMEEIEKLSTELEQRRQAADEVYRERWAVLDRDDRIGREQTQLVEKLRRRREEAAVWLRLSELIGSADGAKFRRFAQNLTLVQLLHLANHHLAKLHPRYELQRAPGGDLVLQVVDRYMADEVRGVHSLSGGERFLISLALALGLASLSSSHGIRVESLFIDEGFGALDAQSLSMAVSVLERLQATGRRIGVISHVEELKERIAVKVEVTPQGGGRSTVVVTSS